MQEADLARRIRNQYFAACTRIAKTRGREFTEAEKGSITDIIHALEIEEAPAELVVLLASHFAAAPARDAIADTISAAKALHKQTIEDAEQFSVGAQTAAAKIVVDVESAIGAIAYDHLCAVKETIGNVNSLRAEIVALRGEVVMIKSELSGAVGGNLKDIVTNINEALAKPLADYVLTMDLAKEEARRRFGSSLVAAKEEMENATQRLLSASHNAWGQLVFGVIMVAIGVFIGRLFS